MSFVNPTPDSELDAEIAKLRKAYGPRPNDAHVTEDHDLPRFTCVSYCRCETRRGHFVKEPDGVWVRFADVERLLDGALIHVARGSVELTGLSWQLRAARPATNQDLRAIASLLTAAAYKLEQNPGAVDTRIEA